jgi:hypothetical protein
MGIMMTIMVMLVTISEFSFSPICVHSSTSSDPIGEHLDWKTTRRKTRTENDPRNGKT